MAESLAFDFEVPPVDPRQTGPTGEQIPPRDWGVTAEEVLRLSAQNAKVLARLQQGPASNLALSSLALKYTSRISDLRAAGYEIENYIHDRKTGESWYRLVTR